MGYKPFNYLETPHGKLMLAYQARRDMSEINSIAKLQEHAQKWHKQQAERNKQVGGDHYTSMAIQPVEYNEKNKLSYLEGNVVKYVSRHGRKNGKEDLLKAIDCLEKLIEIRYPEEAAEL